MDNIARIKLFLEGKLSDEDKATFELELKNNEALQEELEDYRKIFSGFKGLSQESFKDQVQAWNKELPDIKEPKTVSLWSRLNIRKMAAAALIIIISSVAMWALWPKSLDQFIADNYESIRIPKLRSEVNSESVFEKMKDAFEEKDYDTCSSLAKNIPAKDPSYLDIKFLEGHAYYLQKKYDEAIEIFNVITKIDNKNEFYNRELFNKDNAQWTSILSRSKIYINKSDDRMRSEIIGEAIDFLKTRPKKKYRLKCEELLDILD